MSDFKHLICCLCSIVNKLWVSETWKSFHSDLIYITHNVQTFRSRCCVIGKSSLKQ